MSQFFKKIKPAGPKKVILSKKIEVVQLQFVSLMKRFDNKLTGRQKKFFWGAFFLLVSAVHLVNIYQVIMPSEKKENSPSRQSISPAKDITLPDSLDIKLIQKFRELKTKQDSISGIKH